MSSLTNQRFLTVYSGVLTVAFAVTVLCGFVLPAKKTAFEEIDVQRINIVEPDGKIRLIISDKDKFPGSYIKGTEFARPDRKTTGMIFMDDEGTEMGGLTFHGSRDKDGKVQSDGHLSFDQYMQDQTFSIDAGEEDGKRYSAITISDRGDYPITEGLEAVQRIHALPQEQRQAEWKKFMASHPGDHSRIAFGRSTDKSAVLRMKDPDGHDRLVIQVMADGSPVIKFLDKDGRVISQLPNVLRIAPLSN